MKSLVTLSLFLFCILLQGQENTLKTESVVIDDFISFIVNNFHSPSKSESNSVTQKSNNLTFLIETGKDNFSKSDETILNQGFKLLSNRLSKNDKISIAVYSGQNGLIIKNESPNQLKKILHAINSVTSNIITPFNDGIGDTYAFANKNLNANSNNTLVFLRTSGNKVSNSPVLTSKVEPNQLVEVKSENKTSIQKVDKPKNSNLVLLTAITLLPEIIQIIKD